MKRITGIILTVSGLAGVIYYGIEYLEDSDSFSVLGTDVAVSTGNYTPILISLVVMLIGLLLIRRRR